MYFQSAGRIGLARILAWAMSFVECGEHVPRDWIEEGYTLALRALESIIPAVPVEQRG